MSNSYEEISGGASRRGTVNIGHGNFILRSRIVSVLGSSSLPMKRFREKASEQNLLVDATKGKKTKSLIVTDSRHVILSSLTPQTLQDRLESVKQVHTLSQIEMEEGEFVS